MSGIYLITNTVNGKVYVGQSTDVRDRIWHHQSALRHNRHENSHLQRSWNKYGGENFTFEIIEECEESMLDERERYYIAAYDSMDEDHGYNKESGGSLCKHMSEDVVRHLSEVSKGRYVGEKNPMYGKHIPCSEEKKKRLSERFSGSGNPMYGVHRKHTEEENKKASERMKGEGNPFYGKTHTSETIQKMRNTKKNKAVLCVETGVVYVSSAEAGRQLDIDYSHINACCNHKQKTAYGYHWEFVV